MEIKDRIISKKKPRLHPRLRIKHSEIKKCSLIKCYQSVVSNFSMAECSYIVVEFCNNDTEK